MKRSAAIVGTISALLLFGGPVIYGLLHTKASAPPSPAPTPVRHLRVTTVAKVFDLDTRRVVLNCKTISENGTEIVRIGACAPD
jgi:hypothetical protein